MVGSQGTSTITVTENSLIQITTTLPRGCAALSGSGFSFVTIADVIVIITPRQNEGYCNHNVCRLSSVCLSVDILVNTIT